jgi:hypothetical protein
MEGVHRYLILAIALCGQSLRIAFNFALFFDTSRVVVKDVYFVVLVHDKKPGNTEVIYATYVTLGATEGAGSIY